MRVDRRVCRRHPGERVERVDPRVAAHPLQDPRHEHRVAASVRPELDDVPGRDGGHEVAQDQVEIDAIVLGHHAAPVGERHRVPVHRIGAHARAYVLELETPAADVAVARHASLADAGGDPVDARQRRIARGVRPVGILSPRLRLAPWRCPRRGRIRALGRPGGAHATNPALARSGFAGRKPSRARRRR